jgi:hypothetical protein
MTKVLLKVFSKAILDMINKLVALHSSIQIVKFIHGKINGSNCCIKRFK